MFINKTKLITLFGRNYWYLLENSYENILCGKKQRFSMLQQMAHTCHWTLNVAGYVWTESVIDPTNRVDKVVLFCIKKYAGHFLILKIKLEEGRP